MLVLLLISVQLAGRAAGAPSAAGPTSSDQAQTLFDSIFGVDVASDPAADDAGPACRCVSDSCCGAAPLSPEQAGTECLRKGNVCCPPANITDMAGCRLEDGTSSSTNGTSSSRCGIRESVAAHRVAVTPGQFPWLVTVWEGADGGEFLLGAGALIHPRLVVTAAHTVEDKPESSLLVRLGDGSTELKVSKAVLHADWGGRARYHDLALLHLAAPAALGPAVQPACLGPANFDPGAPATLRGCQTVQIVDEKKADSLRASRTQLLSRDQCETALKETGKLPETFSLHDSFICAKTPLGSESACRTESGAPLTCDDPGRPGRIVLVGLLSWNAACRGVLGWPDVFTRMADVDVFCWLERTVTRLLGETQPHFGEPLCQ